MTWREYHEATKHTRDSIARHRHVLDWANMPDPFRHYEDVPVLDLPADPPAAEIPMLDVLQGGTGSATADNGPAFLSQLLFYSAAISAAKSVPGGEGKYALRVNPSSGNLHPTEFHFITHGLTDWPDGLYHYRPSSHMAEQRATGCFDAKLIGATAPVVLVLTSIAWREAWKYGNRAYRYCLLDAGHAWQALELAAHAMGCESIAIGCFKDDRIAALCGLSEDEWPILLLALHGRSIPVCQSVDQRPIWFGGKANRLSPEEVVYPLIRGIHEASAGEASLVGLPRNTKCDGKLDRNAEAETWPEGKGDIKLPMRELSYRSFGEVARARRSALDFQGGAEAMSLAQLSAILDAAARPFSADLAGTPFVHLYLYAHRVDGLSPGVYRYWPKSAELEQLRAGDQRVIAAGLSLKQDLAGNACAAFSMVADLERAAGLHGDRGYRFVHLEAGAIGQRMYLAAEALHLQATGIGAFYDDDVNRYLDLGSRRCEVIYHFAIGHAIPDARLQPLA
jgi:SagB-type dehydrogenase family enzyme